MTMAAPRDEVTAADERDDPATDELQPAPIPAETLRSISALIARHPDEMLRVIRRWMDVEDGD
jgi:hypothetical protein